MKFTKKHAIIAAGAVAALGILGGATYKGPPENAKTSATLQQCQQECDPVNGCACTQTCVLWFCWGPYYCACVQATAPVTSASPKK